MRWSERFQVVDSPRSRFLFEVAIEISDALAARAFQHDPNGDDAFLDAGRDTVYAPAQRRVRRDCPEAPSTLNG